jgi:protein subunit release factor A
MLRVIEVKSAEGGADAQMFVKDLADAYTRLFSRFG